MSSMGIYDYINMLDSAADASWLRNEAIANNIANNDTPGYKRQEVAFEAEFAKAIRKSEGTTVDAKVSNLTKSSVRPRTYTDYSEYQYRIDGNNVDIEKENVYLAENQIKYEALINGITAEFTNLKSVMK